MRAAAASSGPYPAHPRGRGQRFGILLCHRPSQRVVGQTEGQPGSRHPTIVALAARVLRASSRGADEERAAALPSMSDAPRMQRDGRALLKPARLGSDESAPMSRADGLPPLATISPQDCNHGAIVRLEVGPGGTQGDPALTSTFGQQLSQPTVGCTRPHHQQGRLLRSPCSRLP